MKYKRCPLHCSNRNVTTVNFPITSGPIDAITSDSVLINTITIDETDNNFISPPADNAIFEDPEVASSTINSEFINPLTYTETRPSIIVDEIANFEINNLQRNIVIFQPNIPSVDGTIVRTKKRTLESSLNFRHNNASSRSSDLDLVTRPSPINYTTTEDGFPCTI